MVVLGGTESQGVLSLPYIAEILPQCGPSPVQGHAPASPQSSDGGVCDRDGEFLTVSTNLQLTLRISMPGLQNARRKAFGVGAIGGEPTSAVSVVIC